MSKFLKVLTFSFFFGFTSLASAQGCVPAPIILGQGYQGGSPCWGSVPQQQIFVSQPVQQVQVIPMAQAVSSGFTRCQTVGALTGGTLGSLAKHHTLQATILGAIAGGVAADGFCSNNQGQQVLVVQQPPQQAGQVVFQQASPVEIIPQARPVQALQVPGGDFQCSLRFNGAVVRIYSVQDDEWCLKLVEYESKRRGWVRAP
jgi:hypothetical protein